MPDDLLRCVLVCLGRQLADRFFAPGAEEPTNLVLVDAAPMVARQRLPRGVVLGAALDDDGLGIPAHGCEKDATAPCRDQGLALRSSQTLVQRASFVSGLRIVKQIWMRR